jgi:hypothetical protein
MASKTSIANAAFRLIGAATINNFEEDTEEARTAKDTYQDTVDELLRAHPWNFAMCRQTLTAASPSPDWQYTYAYNLPATPNYCLRVWEVSEEDEDSGKWKIEGRRIVTDLTFTDGLPIRFTQRITDPAQFDALFRAALSALLAYKWFEALSPKGTEKKEELRELVKTTLAEARAADGQEGIPDSFGVNEWLNARN